MVGNLTSDALYVDHFVVEAYADATKTRYLVGMDAHAQAILARIVPDRMRDRMMAWMLKLPKSVPAEASAPERQPEDSLT